MATIAIIITTIALVAFGAYLCVNAYQSAKNPEEWAKFLDDAGVKRN